MSSIRSAARPCGRNIPAVRPVLLRTGRCVSRARATGAAVVEFALILPVFLLLVLGVVELSVMFHDQAVITNASREAARAGVVLRKPKASVDEIRDVAVRYAKAYLISFDQRQLAPAVSVPSGVGGDFGTPLTVTVSYSYTPLARVPFLGWLSQPVTLAATTVMNNE